MPRPQRGPCRQPAPRPGLEIADIFRTHAAAYRQGHTMTAEQRAVMHAIEVCRTEALGGHVDVCDGCGFTRPAYNSCRNRHCPKCQSLRQAQWIEQRMDRVLPTHYFHLVFTLPAALRPLVARNRRRLFALLFQAASQTLRELGRDPARLGGELGVTAVLHTWTRKLEFHPHLHCIVTGGGLAPNRDRWVPATRRYLFPVKVLSRLFRGKFLALLVRAYEKGELELPDPAGRSADPAAFRRLVDRLYRRDWVVYAKQPFGGPRQVFAYLGRYTHRVGISNHRLQAIDDDGVRFATKNGQSETLAPVEFIRRFLLHVLPAGFVKMRHYGLLAASKATTDLERARSLLEADGEIRDERTSAKTAVHADGDIDWRVRLFRLTGVDLSRCPACQVGTMVRTPIGKHVAVRGRAPPQQKAA